MMPSSQARAASSPSSARRAVTKSWNEALVGAHPMRPDHAGSVKSRIEAGRSASVELIGVVHDRSSPTRQADPVALRRPERRRHLLEQGLGQRHQRTGRRQLPEEAGALGVVHVGRRVVALLLDEQQHLGGVAVAHLGVDPGRRLELLEQRTDEILAAARVHGHRAVDRRIIGRLGRIGSVHRSPPVHRIRRSMRPRRRRRRTRRSTHGRHDRFHRSSTIADGIAIRDPRMPRRPAEVRNYVSSTLNRAAGGATQHVHRQHDPTTTLRPSSMATVIVTSDRERMPATIVGRASELDLPESAEMPRPPHAPHAARRRATMAIRIV
jgi:hypothetical protein